MIFVDAAHTYTQCSGFILVIGSGKEDLLDINRFRFREKAVGGDEGILVMRVGCR